MFLEVHSNESVVLNELDALWVWGLIAPFRVIVWGFGSVGNDFAPVVTVTFMMIAFNFEGNLGWSSSASFDE